MSRKIVYHGSDHLIEKPIFHFKGSNKENDYGIGFYCTQNLDMAKEWADKETSRGCVNKYEINESGLKILDLCDKEKYSVLNWLAILMHYRYISTENRIIYEKELTFLEKYFINVEEYDVVVGYRADDAYFRFPMMFVRGQISFERMEEIYLLGNLGKQYVLISEKSFKQIKFINMIPVEPIFHDRYVRRIESANLKYFSLERKESFNKEGHKIQDLIK